MFRIRIVNYPGRGGRCSSYIRNSRPVVTVAASLIPDPAAADRITGNPASTQYNISIVRLYN
ncbi:MAG: hypothetical protein WDO16_06540 [Bacteroidota bacterium]